MFVKDGRRGSWLSRGWSLFWLVWVDAVFVLTFAFGLVHCGGWLVVMVAGCKSYWMLDSSFFYMGMVVNGHVGLLLSSFGVVVMVEITKLKHESDNTKVQ